MIEILVTFDNADFLRTRINCTLEEAKEYYINNYFTFGTSEENEYKAKVVNVFLYDEWKENVLDFCMKNKNAVLSFDDDKEELIFNTVDYPSNRIVNLSYETIHNTMLGVHSWC
ncbi:hypothetical protein D7X33_22260 [Butyricicoccus sp. 1XD8-22]|nr:hypothetical protein D7X33_22260 [Butyricicoccus sp. 1XD8-22]